MHIGLDVPALFVLKISKNNWKNLKIGCLTPRIIIVQELRPDVIITQDLCNVCSVDLAQVK